MMYRARLLLLFIALQCAAQVHSPVIRKVGQPDASDLHRLAADIYHQADARTPREKAEAIWRFFLTDGRFVKPGMIYHIAGWAYEEPQGEVLDPIKLLHSYGFGLCYHIAPLLEAMWEAGGFADARVWFLTGHTVAEVFYDGAYHYFDSDMMGYNPVGTGPLKQRPVASVHQIEQDGRIILDKLAGPKQVDTTAAGYPWYPADVKENAIPDLAQLFTTTNDNWVYPFTRYAQGHQMNFVLRPGERMIRNYRPESDDAYYLPYQTNGTTRKEFPRELAEYKIRTSNGPRSQKDSRTWATGRMEYHPPVPQEPSFVISMPCPYVIIDARFDLQVQLPSAVDWVRVETSTDGGRTWALAGNREGPFTGAWQTAPAVAATTAHGRSTAVTGSYGYLARFTAHESGALRDVALATRFQVNPRTLPELTAGTNRLEYEANTADRIELPVQLPRIGEFTHRLVNIKYAAQAGQGFLRNETAAPGEAVFAVAAPAGGDLLAFSAGGRFLDLREGRAPDKLTAEVRQVAPWPANAAQMPVAELAWSLTPDGPYQPLWSYDAKLVWRDGQPIDRTLRWPEVDRQVPALPAGTRVVYVRYRLQGMALDDIRLAMTQPARRVSPLQITHIWRENGVERRHSQEISVTDRARPYAVETSPGASISNEALILECPRPAARN